MANEVEAIQAGLDTELSVSLNNAATVITKKYLNELEKYEILPASQEDKDVDITECGKFFRLKKLVLSKEENFLNKLTTIVNVASSINCSLITVIKSDGNEVEYLVGIISKNARSDKEHDIKRRAADAKAFGGAINGNLTGSDIFELSEGDISKLRRQITDKNNKFSAVSGIVALRDAEDKSIEGYVQGIENLVDSLKGLKYTVIMIADPVGTEDLEAVKQGYKILYTQLASFAKSSVTVNESDTLSVSKSRTVGITEGISKGIALTQSKSKSYGRNMSISSNVGVSYIVTAGTGISAGIGISAGVSSGTQEGMAKAESSTESKQRQHGVSDQEGISKTTGKSLQLNYENKMVAALLEKIDKHLERLDECESFGAFDCAAYVIAGERETALSVAANYNAIMRGNNSNVQASHINSWYKEDETKRIAEYLGSMVHPRFASKDKQIIVTPASVVSGDELAIQIGLPKKSITGITVIPMTPFGRNVEVSSEKSFELGNLYHMGKDDGIEGKIRRVSVDVDSLTMHTFITGSTGSGKSTAIYSILDKLIEKKIEGEKEKIKFLVIEPAKGEYKDRFGNYPDVEVYGTNNKKMPLLRINPFSFPEDIHILEHIDRLIEIFNVCWPMYAAMPAVLKDAVERAYTVSGWNTETSTCKYRGSDGKPIYPSFIDVLEQINLVMNESAYSADSKGDYKGALCTRLKSLTNGLYGQIFTSNELSCEELFDKNVIIDLSRTGSSETKSLIMGILVMKLQEYRMATAEVVNSSLRHVTVLEEAHNILKRTSSGQSGEGSNMIGKSVEMLANAIAEMRTYGEGFIIADQAPGLMDMSVIRNTNTKIILRLPDYDDRQLVGRAANLDDDRIVELSRLKTFVAAVYQNNWLEPVLCNIDTNFKNTEPYKYVPKTEVKPNRIRILEYLLLPIEKRNTLDKKYVDGLIDSVSLLPVSTASKIAFRSYVGATEKEEIQTLREKIVFQLFNTEIAFSIAKNKESDIDRWYKCIRDNLEPSIAMLEDEVQKKIIALLTKEKAHIDKTRETQALFKRLMGYI